MVCYGFLMLWVIMVKLYLLICVSIMCGVSIDFSFLISVSNRIFCCVFCSMFVVLCNVLYVMMISVVVCWWVIICFSSVIKKVLLGNLEIGKCIVLFVCFLC